MKLYLIIRWDYNQPVSNYSVYGIYTDKDKAEKACEKFNIDNDDKAVYDSYGPLRGSRFAIWERDLDE